MEEEKGLQEEERSRNEEEGRTRARSSAAIAEDQPYRTLDLPFLYHCSGLRSRALYKRQYDDDIPQPEAVEIRPTMTLGFGQKKANAVKYPTVLDETVKSRSHCSPDSELREALLSGTGELHLPEPLCRVRGTAYIRDSSLKLHQSVHWS